MPIAVDPGKTFDYVLECDRTLPAEEQTVFEIKVLSARELADIEDKATKFVDGGLEFRTGSQVLKILELGVKGWKNFRGRDGAEISFRDNNGRPRPENWDLLRPEWRRELSNAVTEQNRVTEAERKNSPSSPPSSSGS